MTNKEFKERYKIDEGYCIKKADKNTFLNYYAVYSGYKCDGGFFKKSYELIKTDIYTEDCFWIQAGNNRIGGVALKKNEITQLFFIPPFSKEKDILPLLIKLLVDLSDKGKDISVFTTESAHIEIYENIGFQEYERGRWMIRPTEEFNVQWENEFKIINPKKEHSKDIESLLYEAFGEEHSLEFWKQFSQEYFDESKYDGVLNQASTLVYDKKTNELIGACLISQWQEWPLVSQIGVKKSYEGKGIGTRMLKVALSSLKDHYPVVRLYAMVGGKAEKLYYNLGFLKGIELVYMNKKY